MKNKFLYIGLLALIPLIITPLITNTSCQKDCYYFDYGTCPPRDEQYIIVKFNMDSTGNGFTINELENVEVTYAREFYTEERQAVTEFLGFDFENYIFKAMYSFYCCGDGNAGFKIFNNNTNRVQIVDNVKYKKERTYDYCCGNYYYVKRFDFNGNRMNGGDTIYFNND